MKSAIALLLLTLPCSASAQTTQTDRHGEVVANLRACVRDHAALAQATEGDPLTYLVEICRSQTGDMTGISPVPPGIFRRVVSEEWAAFLKEKSGR